jgi:hypothetical protein
LIFANLRGTEIEKVRCWERHLKPARGRVKPEFVWRHLRGTCVEALMGFRLTRVRCKDAVTDLEEAIPNCHDIALLVLTIASIGTRPLIYDVDGNTAPSFSAVG